jgi:hypothetical protein
MKMSMPNGFEFEALDTDILRDEYQEAEWYRPHENNHQVAAVRCGDLVATIEAAGEMRISNGDRVVRYSDELPTIGITNDDDVSEAYLSGDYEIVNNPWFEVWIGDWCSEPVFSVGEGIEQAVMMINDERKVRGK